MNGSYDLIEPIQKRVNQIKESLYPKRLHSSGKEALIYGTFESSFETFCTLSLRKGFRANESDFYNATIKELEEIEDSVLLLEQRINEVEHNSIQFHAIIGIIHEVKQRASKLLNVKGEAIPKIAEVKPRSTRSKITYKWLKNDDKLHKFKSLLIKNKLIDHRISFQDFKAIFTGQPINQIENCIKWSNDNVTQLLYLIKYLMDNEILKKPKQNYDYIQMNNCFERLNGEKFTGNFRTLMSKIEFDVSEDYKAILKNIVSHLLN